LVYVGGVEQSIEGQLTAGIHIVRDEGTTLSLLGLPAPVTAFDLVVNGAGRAVFMRGWASSGTGIGLSEVGVADVSDPARPAQLITAFPYEGPRVVGRKPLTLYNGLAYMVNTGHPITGLGGGVRMINYMPMDTPLIPIESEENGPAHEEN
jgi:hypothetical protein